MMDEGFASSTNGIITLQIGHYSNFVGTHWWNIQQSSRKQQVKSNGPNQETSSINHEVLLREGKNGDYTPRLVTIDLKGSLRSLREDGTIQKDQNVEEKHQNIGMARLQQEEKMSIDQFSPNDISIHHTEPYKKNDFLQNVSKQNEASSSTPQRQTTEQSFPKDRNVYDLNDVVEVWSDYLGNDYHHQSVLLLDNYSHSSDSSSFSSFGHGYSMNGDDRFWDSWEDKMHFFVEECDTLQGFQVLADLDNGFGGLSTRVLQNLQDSYGPKTISTFGFWPGTPNEYIDKNVQMINSALAVGYLTQDSTIFAPMSLQEKINGKNESSRQLPNLSYNASSHYHTSAIIASALDTTSLPYRIGGSSLGDFCNSLTRTGHKIVTSSISLPLATKSRSLEELFHTSCLYNDGLLGSLMPSCDHQKQRIFSQNVALRGIPAHQAIRSEKKGFPKIVSNKDLFESYIFSNYKSVISGTVFWEEALRTVPPYPQYFSPKIDNHGFFNPLDENKAYVNDAPVMTSLFTSSGTFNLLYDVLTSARKLKRSRFASMELSGMEQDEINENYEVLHNLANVYDEEKATELL